MCQSPLMSILLLLLQTNSGLTTTGVLLVLSGDVIKCCNGYHLKKAHISQQKDPLHKSLTKQETVVKCLTKTQHIQAKEHRMVSLNLEEANKSAIAALLEERNLAIDEAFATATIKT